MPGAHTSPVRAGSARLEDTMPTVAIHRTTRERRAWNYRSDAERALADELDAWDLADERLIGWGFPGVPMPRPDGRPSECGGRPVYATPDGKPAN